MRLRVKPMFTMHKTKLIIVAALSLVAPVGGCSSKPTEQGPSPATSSPEGKKITSTSVVTAEPQTTEISAGSSGEAVVRLAIENGYHVNANPPTYPYLKATELEIKPAEGVSIGKVTYPQPVTTKFEFAERPLAVYEGTSQIKAELKAEKGIQPGKRTLNGVLRIQACDDHVCYPPGKIELQIPVTIK